MVILRNPVLIGSLNITLPVYVQQLLPNQKKRKKSLVFYFKFDLEF